MEDWKDRRLHCRVRKRLAILPPFHASILPFSGFCPAFPGAASQPAQVALDELPRSGAGERNAIGQDVQMVARVDEAGQRNDGAASAVRIRQTVTVWVRAGERQKIVLAEQAA